LGREVVEGKEEDTAGLKVGCFFPGKERWEKE